jgi:hypothetical protein
MIEIESGRYRRNEDENRRIKSKTNPPEQVIGEQVAHCKKPKNDNCVDSTKRTQGIPPKKIDERPKQVIVETAGSLQKPEKFDRALTQQRGRKEDRRRKSMNSRSK